MAARWTKVEEEFLSVNYPDKGSRYCAENLNRTLKSVSDKARRLGLKVVEPCKAKKRTTEEYNIEIQNSGCKAIEEYINNHTPILHRCREGHTWKTGPDSILKGSGCPSCASYRFDLEKPAILYFVSFAGEFYKLGITNKSVSARFAGDWQKHGMKLEWSINFPTGLEAKELETKLLSSIDKFNTGLLKRGNTETTRQYIEKPVLR